MVDGDRAIEIVTAISNGTIGGDQRDGASLTDACTAIIDRAIENVESGGIIGINPVVTRVGPGNKVVD